MLGMDFMGNGGMVQKGHSGSGNRQVDFCGSSVASCSAAGEGHEGGAIFLTGVDVVGGVGGVGFAVGGVGGDCGVATVDFTLGFV